MEQFEQINELSCEAHRRPRGKDSLSYSWSFRAGFISLAQTVTKQLENFHPVDVSSV